MTKKPQLSVVPLGEALRGSSAFFGRSRVTPLDRSSKVLRRTQKKLGSLFENLSGLVVEGGGILHEKSGMVFAETRIGNSDFLIGCFTAKPQQLTANVPLELVTGVCMFGGEAILGQADDKNYDLTYPADTQSVQGIIERIVVEERVHLYEAETIARLSACINNLCSQLKPVHATLTIHVPVPEYCLYGVDLYVRGHMSTSALSDYMAAVRRRGSKLEDLLRQHLTSDLLKIKFNSPLDWICDLDFFALQPAEIPQVLYALAAEQEDLWQKLTRNASGQPLQLNYLSYIHQYLQAARRMQHEGSQLVFIENPEELPIYLNSVKWQTDTGIAVDKATMLYVHPRLMVAKKAYADSTNLLYYCADGFNEQTIALAISQYKSI